MFDYKWYLKDGYPSKSIDNHKLKVYSTFACGGGSTMGYKLAGYDVIGANDIDPQMAKVYKENHSPKYYDLCPIRELLNKDLPKEYYNLDILDGSPPCSTFSIAGSREKAWKKKKKFREGQAAQELSDLFFDWIKLVDRLKPKIAVAENVKGMLMGNAKSYTNIIIQELNKIGYDVQLFLINASTMGVPQKRERVFFICRKMELKLPKINLVFNMRPITFKDVDEGYAEGCKVLSPGLLNLYDKVQPGKSFSTVHPKGSFFNSIRLDYNKVPNTIAAKCGLCHPKYPRLISKKESCLIGSFPLDYNFLDINPHYLIGMSVPPVMMAQVAYQVYLQLFKNRE